MESPSFVRTLRGKIVVAIGLALIAIVLQWLMFPLIGKRAPFLMFVPAILLTAMVGGPLLSLAVMAAGVINGVLLLTRAPGPMPPLTITYVVLLIYVVAGLMVAALGSRLHVSILRTREAEGRLKVALSDTGVALFDIDLRAQTIFASGALRKLLGQPLPENDRNCLMSLDEWGRGFAQDEMENWRAMVKQCQTRKIKVHESTHSIVSADGALNWLLIKTHFDFNSAARIVRLRGVVLDITERKQIDLQLEEARAELGQQVDDWKILHELSNDLLRSGTPDEQARAILETVTAFHHTDRGLISVFDSASDEQNIVCCSGFSAAAVEQLMGRSTASNAGASGLAFIERRQVIIEDTETDERYARFRSFSRSHGFRAVYATPFFGSDGAIIGVVTVHFPTPRRPAERELRFADIYAGSVALFFERMLTETALREERDRNRLMLETLREADRRKDEFVAMLAHELRNPLAPITMAAQMLNMEGMDEQRLRETGAIIARQASHMVRLVDDLLDVSRVTRGLVKLAHEPVDIENVLTAAAEQARPLIQTRRHRLLSGPVAATAWVMGDRTRLVQIVTNLLNNAAKYTPPGGEISLFVEVSATRVEISVRDNGVGIDETLMPVVFELFTQAERSSDRTQGGLGLGLALVKSLTELQGGSARAASSGRGRGSSFTISLPRLEHDTGAPDDERRSQPRASADPAAVTPLRILVVDDNVDAARTLAAVLEASGHQVLSAHDAVAALRLAQTAHPDCVILDIGLPDRDGYEVARQLRAENTGPRQPLLIALTGYGHDEHREKSRGAGFQHHLVKPADPARLTSLLADYAAQNGAGC